jgi:hypothetical protein
MAIDWLDVLKSTHQITAVVWAVPAHSLWRCSRNLLDSFLPNHETPSCLIRLTCCKKDTDVLRGRATRACCLMNETYRRVFWGVQGMGTYMASTHPVHITIGIHPTPTATFGRGIGRVHSLKIKICTLSTR